MTPSNFPPNGGVICPEIFKDQPSPHDQPLKLQVFHPIFDTVLLIHPLIKE